MEAVTQGRDRRGIAGIILIVIIIVGDLITGAASTHAPVSHDTTSLGTWVNMPSASTELMGNTSYRAIVVPVDTVHQIPSLLVTLIVNCITLSNTIGANLQLQDAIYDTASQTNATNFANISTGIIDYIDGSTSNPGSGTCLTNNSIAASAATLAGNAPAAGQGFIFRVVGSGGGGAGDNPRFATVAVAFYSNLVRIFLGRASSVTTSGFTANVITNLIPGSSVATTYNWFATNVTTINCGTGDHCFESGTGSCTIAANAAACSQAKTFTTIFINTVNVFVNPTTVQASVQYNLGQADLLKAQTLTV